MMKLIKINKWWLAWVVFSLLFTAFYMNALVGKDKSVFLPGDTTSGHYQIEQQCEVCHGDGFDDQATLQKSCMRCHGVELKQVEDSHPKSKFTDPRNADRLAILDARYCVTCHVEHKAAKTQAMGVTLPEDYCFLCHQDVAKNRPSHQGMGFETCDDAGCHNYHDNKALYEDYLLKHMDQADHLPEMQLPEKNLQQFFHAKDEKYKKVLTAEDMDFPENISMNQRTIYQWQSTAHATSGVNCLACHDKQGEWQFKPNVQICKQCHDQESAGFLAGKHGVRLAQELPAMTVKQARLRLHDDAEDKSVHCQSCHSDHAFNTEKAAVDACLKCHADEHSQAYKKSKHYRVWLLSKSDQSQSAEGVTCATCHLPRRIISDGGIKRVLVDHNQNNTLRPNEKMVRSVCMNCHALKFSLESLADNELIRCQPWRADARAGSPR